MVVVVLSAINLSALARVRLEESEARGDLLANAIYHRARQVVGGQTDPYAALREDSGLRSILESSIYSKNVTYAAVLDTADVVVAHTDPGREGERLAPRGDLNELLGRSSLAQLRAIYTEEGRTYEVQQPLRLGTADFGSIRIGVSTLLVRQDLGATLRPPLYTALIALGVAAVIASLLTQVLLRPIHVIGSGLAQLRKGRARRQRSTCRNRTSSASWGRRSTRSARRSPRTGPRRPSSSRSSKISRTRSRSSMARASFCRPTRRCGRSCPPTPVGRPIDDLLPHGHRLVTLVQETLATRDSKGWVPVIFGLDSEGPSDGDTRERLVMTEIIEDTHHALVGTMVSVQKSGGARPRAVDHQSLAEAGETRQPAGGSRTRGEKPAQRHEDSSRAPARQARRARRNRGSRCRGGRSVRGEQPRGGHHGAHRAGARRRVGRAGALSSMSGSSTRKFAGSSRSWTVSSNTRGRRS